MRKLLALLASSLLFALVPTSASAITGESVEDWANQYPFVGMLAFYDEDGSYMWRCSGTLMSETVVLTASHCTYGTSAARVYFDVEVTDDFRNDPKKGKTGTPVTHPAYNPNTLDNDVAVVVLDKSVKLKEYPVLPAEGFLSDLKDAGEIDDDVFVAVGYGGHDTWPPPNLVFDLIRRSTSSPYGGLTQNNLHVQQNPNVADGGTCGGDSGGPHFWQDTLTLVSVTSWGDVNCRSNDMTQRTDLASVLDFLAGYGLSPA
jgi:secreted trypsin-like serine protease